MNQSQKFNDMVAINAYPTYSEFKNALMAFQKATGYVFVKRTIRRFNEGDPFRKTTIYRGLYYSCTCWGENRKPRKRGTNCGSFIKVKGVDGFLHVIAWNMVHNHLPQMKKTHPSSEVGVPIKTTHVEHCSDLTHLFLSVFPQIWFLNSSQFERNLKEFERISGIQYEKVKSDSAEQSIRICSQHWNGCKSTIVLQGGNGLIRITHFDMTHTHVEEREKMEISSPLKERNKLDVISAYPPFLEE